MKKDTRDVLKGLAFISPWIIGFLCFQFYPIGASIYYSFCHYNVLHAPVFIGMDNYQDLLTDDVFLKSVTMTFIYAALALPTGLLTSLIFAILLNQKVYLRGIFRTIYFLPSLVPMVAMAILWRWIFAGDNGILNHVLAAFNQGLSFCHIPLQLPIPNWLSSPMWATPAIVLTGLWGVGGAIVIYLAALQDVPRHLYEAADIDGASWISKTRHVTLPMISPVIFFNLIMGVINCLQVFAVPYIMTGGGPVRSTYYYTMYLFDNAFRDLRMGYASSMAIVMGIVVLILTLITAKMAAKKVYYAGN
jgi:multiple sugar transport system permease protein